MKRFNCATIRLLLVGFVAAVVLSGDGNVKADFMFGKAVNLGPVVNSSAGDLMRGITADGLEMYIVSNRPGGQGGWDIWVSTRQTKDADWALPPENLGARVNSPSEEFGATISPDGLTLYFSSSNRAGGYGFSDIWMTTRATNNDPWEPPVNLGPPVNGSAWDQSPWISADGLKLYFVSTRGGSYNNFTAYEIWVTTRVTESSPWAEPVNLGMKYSPGIPDMDPWVSADDRLLFFRDWGAGIYRPGGFGAGDMWFTMRRGIVGNWGIPVNLGPQVNGPYDDGPACISADGQTLYFSSERPGGLGGRYGDMYQAPIIPIVDFNGDGKVNIQDLLRLIESWGKDDPSVDIGPMPWGDGKVDEKDLEVLMSYWQQETLPGSLIAYWKLDETEGAMAHDSAGTNDASVMGGPFWQPTGGQVGGALQLDGVDDYLITPFILNPANGPFSVFAWVKGGIPGHVIVSQIGGADWLCADPSEGRLTTSLLPPPARIVPPPLVSELVITDGNWHRVGFVGDGSHRRLYVDGVVAAEDTQAALAGSANGLFIGCNKAMEPGTFWSGLIDDVRIYNRVVSP